MGVLSQVKDYLAKSFLEQPSIVNVSPIIPEIYAEIVEESGMESNISPAKIQVVRSPGMIYNRIDVSNIPGVSRRKPNFQPCEYDLVELGKLEDLDGFVRRSFRAKEGLMFKEGYNFVGSNVERVEYIKARLAQMEAASGLAFLMLLRQTAANLLRYSNAFWVKVRKAEASGGRVRRMPTGSPLEPVAAYFSLPPETIEIDASVNGTVKAYKQCLPTGEEKIFNPRDIVHFYIDKKDGFLFGTPITVPVQNDIYALRRIEENIETLVHQCLFPLYQYKVGSEEHPGSYYPDGRNEIDVVRYEMRRMPPEGMIITPFTHEIENLGSGDKGLKADSYLQYFKQRVFSGLGVSSVDMGEGGTSSRSTADTMSRNMVDDVKSYQDVLESFIGDLVIKELLIESTFDQKDLFAEENMVHLKFQEIDLESRMKVENQAIQLFENNAITHTEFRREIGREPFKEDEEWMDTKWELYEQPTLLIQASGDPFGAPAQAAAESDQTAIEPAMNAKAISGAKQMVKLGKAAQAGAKKPVAKRPSGTSANRARPRNQSGTRSAPKMNRDYLMTDSLVELYRQARESGDRTVDSILSSNAVQIVFTAIQRDLLLAVREALRKGLSSVGANPLDASRQRIGAQGVLEGRVNRYTDKLKRSLVNRLMNAKDKQELMVAFDSLEYRLEFMERTERAYALNIGRMIGLLEQGIVDFEVHGKDTDCETCSKGLRFSSLGRTIEYEKVPPMHPNCYSKDTEIYTDRGFQLVKDVELGQKVLSLNPETRDLEWASVIATVQNFEEELLHFRSSSENRGSSLDLLVTKDHNMLYMNTWDHRQGRESLRLGPASALPREYLLYNQAKWQSFDNLKQDDILFGLSRSDFYTFLGYYLSEGSLGRYEISLSQFKPESKAIMASRILPMFNDAGYYASAVNSGFYIKHNELYKYLEQFGRSHEKFVPDFIKQSSPELIQVFLEAYCLGDGSIQEGFYKGKAECFQPRQMYSTSSKRMADDLGELLLKSGSHPSYFVRSPIPVEHKNGIYTAKYPQWNIYVCNSEYHWSSSIVTDIVSYNDYVYCVELDKNHTLFTRRNGKCVWSGNCSCLLMPAERTII